MANTLPPGYYHVDDDGDDIIVAMDFSHFNQECEPTIQHNGRTYKWGPLEFMKTEDASYYCCRRRYTPVDL